MNTFSAIANVGAVSWLSAPHAAAFISPPSGRINAIGQVSGLQRRVSESPPTMLLAPATSNSSTKLSRFPSVAMGHGGKDKRMITLQHRMGKAMRNSPLDPNLINQFSDSVSWITHMDYLVIYKIASGRYDDSGPPSLIEEPIAFQLKCGSTLSLNSQQAEQLMKSVGAFMEKTFGTEQDEVNALRHMLMVVKTGVSLEALYDIAEEISGRLGRKVFEELLALNIQRTHSTLCFEGDEEQLAEAHIIDARTWQRKYEAALLRRLDPESIAQQVCEEAPIDTLQPFKIANQRVQQKYRSLIATGTLGKSIWFSSNSAMNIYCKITETILKARYQSGVVGPIPRFDPGNALEEGGAHNRVQDEPKQHKWSELVKAFRAEGTNNDAHEVADAIEKGFINIHLLTAKQFHTISYHFSGSSLIGKALGFSVGPNIFVKNPYPVDGRREQLEPRDHETWSVILHEGVHALDWYKDEKMFLSYHNGVGMIKYAMERHAFYTQRHYLHQLGEPFQYDSIKPDEKTDLVLMKESIEWQYGCKDRTKFKAWSAKF